MRPHSKCVRPLTSVTSLPSALPSKQARQITTWLLNGKVNYLKERSKGDGYILTLSTLCFLIFVVQISKKQTKKSVGWSPLSSLNYSPARGWSKSGCHFDPIKWQANHQKRGQKSIVYSKKASRWSRNWGSSIPLRIDRLQSQTRLIFVLTDGSTSPLCPLRRTGGARVAQ